MKLLLLILFFSTSLVFAQSVDTSILIGKQYVTLKPVVVDTKLNVPAFIHRIKSDTSFYKAFKNLRIIGYTAINDIRMLDKKQHLIASLHSTTQQKKVHDCRTMQTIREESTGDFFTNKHAYNYYTADLYASLFFTKDTICNETNIVGNKNFSLKNKSGMEKHKEQLKMLFFNPGQSIPGLPFMSGKTAIYDDEMGAYYDLSIDMEMHSNISCYVFKQKVKPGKEDHVIVDEMTTWFNDSTFDVVARNYSLSYDAGLYDFNVNMEVELTSYKTLLVPSLIRYNGDWKVLFKKREHGVFTATLFDFQ